MAMSFFIFHSARNDYFITSEFQKTKFRFRLWRDQIGKFRCDPAKGGPKEDSARANASAYLVGIRASSFFLRLRAIEIPAR